MVLIKHMFSISIGGIIMKTITLDVKGMHCSSCEEIIKDSLEETDGITKAEVSNENSNAVIEFDENSITEDKIKEIIIEEGYGAE